MKKVHFFSHTHWDREWLRSSDASRIKLVYIFEQLLDILENDNEYKCFIFDGQTAALEDFLAIRPDSKDRVKALVEAKRLFIGPWYTQPDMFLASGESLIRNLLVGYNIANKLGHSLNVGWIPDAFGQIAKTPVLFKKFDFDGAFVWRGFDYEMLEDQVFIWEASNEKILTVNFPLGYGYYRYLPQNKEQALKDVMDTINRTENRFKDNHILFMGGSDYAVPQSYIPNSIKNIKEDLKKQGYEIEMSNPEKFLDEVKEALSENKRDLQVFKGEARSASLGRIHAGISSTRVDIKNDLKKYETMLNSMVEPFSVFNEFIGGKNYQELLNYYWKIIFKNQFHDSAYSSSPDTVNQTVKNRLLNLRHGLNELSWLNLRYLKTGVDFSTFSREDEALILFNSLPYKRNDLTVVSMILKAKSFNLYDEFGNLVPYQIINQKELLSHEIEIYNGIHNFHDGGELLEGTKFYHQFTIDSSILPSFGYKILKVKLEESKDVEVTSDLKVNNNIMENKFLKVSINPNGTIDVYDKLNHQDYKNIIEFIDDGDDGDEYNYSPCYEENNISISNLTPTVNLVENNAYQIKYDLKYKVTLPSETIDHLRSKDEVCQDFTVSVILEKESSVLKFQTKFDNKAKDHRLRAIINDVLYNDHNLSEDHFGYTIRPNIIENQKGIKGGATEDVLPLYTMQKFVKLCDSNLALMTRGLCEYEIIDNHKIALTLLRAVGKFGKADLKVRPGRSSGYRLDAKSSELLFEIDSSFAINFNAKNLKDLVRETKLYNVDVLYRHVDNLNCEKNKELPFEMSLMEIIGDVEVMAFKKCENSNSHVLRLLNATAEEVKNIEIKISKVNKCYLSNLKEEKLKELPIKNGVIVVDSLLSEDFITLILE